MDTPHSIEEEADRLLAGFEATPLPRLLETARALGREGHGNVISYSRKVFIPLTRLCRDVCGYCTFAVGPRQAGAAYLSPDEVLAIARAGREAGCREALFTLGDKPELRYQAARSALGRLGHASTIEYLIAMCELVVRETGLLPHVNAGIATETQIAALRRVSVSQGIMLENASPRLAEPGGPHFGSPDKDPAVRIAMIEAAGRQRVPFTSGVLIGIGETRRERILSLLVLRDLHARYGHLQEIIIQNFRAKSGTRMAGAAEPSLDDVLWTAATARLVLGPAMNIQVPPNLSFEGFPRLAAAGINDWGGISPVTADHVNPEAPWPSLAALERATAAAGYTLVQRLAIYPRDSRARMFGCRARSSRRRPSPLPVGERSAAEGRRVRGSRPIRFQLQPFSPHPIPLPCGEREQTAARSRPNFAVLQGCLIVRPRASGSNRTISFICSRRAVRRSRRSAPPPTRCAPRPAATSSAMWSIATSITPTSAAMLAASAHSRKAS